MVLLPIHPNTVQVAFVRMSKREWSESDQMQTHGDEASKKRSGHLIAVLHHEVICTIRFSVDEDNDDRKLPAR